MTNITSHHFHPSILREYDIRGVVGETLFPADALALGRTLGTLVAERGGTTVVVGYDGRLTSPELETALCDGLKRTGLTVLRIGLVPTPCLYYAAHMCQADSGVMVTGSHNPPGHNGFKMVVGGKAFYGQAIQALCARAEQGQWRDGDGSEDSKEMLGAYVARLTEGVPFDRPLKVAWDPANGAAGEAVQKLVKTLPGEHLVINGNVDGTFPNHHPDPTVDTNLEQMRDVILAEGCDLGVAFDGDGDRIGVLDGRGWVIRGDQLLAILARDVLSRHPGAPVLADVKASRMLFDEVARLGGRPVMCATGHSIVKSRMAELKAPLAGEMSGHIFFADGYLGYDDGLYAAVRLISHLSCQAESAAAILDGLPQMVNTPEIRVEVPEARKFAIVKEIRAQLETEQADMNTVDGVRVSDERGGWWLIRASNTQNALVLRCEADTREAVDVLKQQVRIRLETAGINLPPGLLC